jgi:hypothetical protein
MNKNYCYPTLNVLSGLQVKLEQEKAFLKNAKYGIPESVKKTFVVWKGSGIDITAAAIAKMSSELETLLSSSFSGTMKKKDSRLNQFEGQASSIVHENLKDMPLEILADEDFWRYVSLVPMFAIVAWRHESLGNNNLGLTAGRGFLRCLPYRMFIRADIAYRHSDGADYSLATAHGSMVDQWASHVLAQQYGAVPRLVQVMLAEFEELRKRKVKKPTEIDREIAKELSQIRSIQVFEFFQDDTEVTKIVSDVSTSSEEKILRGVSS